LCRRQWACSFPLGWMLGRTGSGRGDHL